MKTNLWRYYEGTTSAASFVNDMSKVLCTAVKTEAVLNTDGTIVKDKEVIINKNWDIAFPQPQKDKLVNVMDWNNLTPSEFVSKIDNQLSQSSGTVILKVKTSPKDLSALLNTDDLGLEDDLSVKTMQMYVELYKPVYLADSEKYNPECERLGIQPYNITTDLYKEYASTVGIVELIVTDQYKGIGGVTVEAKDVLLTSTKSWGNHSIGDQNSIVQSITDALNTVFGTPLQYGFSVIIPESQFAKMKNTSTESFISSVTGISSDKFSNYSKLEIKVDRQLITEYNYFTNTYDYYIYTYTFTFHDVYNIYTIPAGWTLELPEKDAVDPTSIVFKVGTAVKQLGKDYTYDTSTAKFKLISGYSGQERILGDPILSYSYIKTQTDITARKLLYNNHYVYVRMFDNIKEDCTGPVQDTIDPNTGDTITVNSHVSEWSKLSWYQDFEEVMISSLDGNINATDITDGIVNLPIDVPGLNSDTRIRFWINTSNDRAMFVIMGNPSLDFGKNRHLISSAYLGQIESFDNSINDTAGNFALFTSSSTTPCDTKSIKKRITLSDSVMVGLGPVSIFTGITLDKDKYFDPLGAYTVTLTIDGSSKVTILNKDSFTLNINSDKTSINLTLLSAPDINVNITLNYTYYIEKYDSIDGIVRDGFGNIINTVYADEWGKNTATGVTDISMFFTRSKAFYQKHHMMFTTTEEFMSKSLYGKSAYTDEYYADRVKLTHGNDGPRGMLYDCLAIDTSSLYAFDELIVNRNFAKDPAASEETFIFFPITAPFSPFSGSPNATYGFAIKKAERLPVPVLEGDIVDAAINQLSLQMGNLQNLIADIPLPDTESNGVTVTWTSSVIGAIEIDQV